MRKIMQSGNRVLYKQNVPCQTKVLLFIVDRMYYVLRHFYNFVQVVCNTNLDFYDKLKPIIIHT